MNEKGYHDRSPCFFGGPLDGLELRVQTVLLAGRRVRAGPHEQLEGRRRIDFLIQLSVDVSATK